MKTLRFLLYATPAAVLVASACSEPKLDRYGNPITVGRFRLRTYPKGAQVWVDGRLAAVSTPATLILKAGEHRLKIQLEGADSIERTIRVPAGASRELSLRIPEPPPATVTVLSDIEGADVHINGYRRGQTPLLGAVTRPGPLDITVAAPDGRARSVQTTLEISQDKTYEVLFTPVTSEVHTAAPDMSQEGRLTLGLQPEGLVLDPEGRLLGRTPIVKKRLAAGLHTLILRSQDGTLERKVTVEVQPETTTVYRFSLRKSAHRRR